ncbi:hypothetical protein E2L06_03345 [Haloterrigena sp. H1]|uniref:hypothetical protein n=1 Tax=Haloterrigena sp. H1 TaxID=2552943 RepID=UPI00110F6183|nr:hypothetical protein [Haloterrigena sp. H1]TMT85678.1 hypothetical protein E2L06_03345 [Haloterrigena sp. H1]
MMGETQRIVAVWAVLTLPFILFATYLWIHDDLSPRFIVAYWFAPIALTLIGVFPAPWQPIAESV